MKTYLKKNEYVPHAPSEPGTVHIHHCKDGHNNDRLYITRKEDGTILAYCHHCGLGGSHHVLGSRTIQARTSSEMAHGMRSHLNEKGHRYDDGVDETFRESRVDRRSEGQGRKLLLHSTRPEHVCKADGFATWGTHAKRWWLGCGLTVKDAEEHGVYYDMERNHLVLNVYKDGDIVGELRKSGEISGPKYLSVGQQTHQIINTSNSNAGTELLLVEDLRSAYKASKLINVLPLLGTQMSSDHKAAIVAAKPSKVLIWLDNDNPQVRRSARSIKKSLQSLVPCVIITYEGKDPKELGLSQLKEILDEESK